MAKRKPKNLQDATQDMDVLPLQEGHPSSKYKVQLTFLPEMEVEAANEQEAIANYNKFLGVRATTNKYSITLL